MNQTFYHKQIPVPAGLNTEHYKIYRMYHTVYLINLFKTKTENILDHSLDRRKHWSTELVPFPPCVFQESDEVVRPSSEHLTHWAINGLTEQFDKIKYSYLCNPISGQILINLKAWMGCLPLGVGNETGICVFSAQIQHNHEGAGHYREARKWVKRQISFYY